MAFHPDLRVSWSSITTVLLYLFFTSSVQAQRYPKKIIDQGDGLPTASVLGIAQDKDGYIFVVCRTGIARFDGRKWHHFTIDDGLKTNHFLHIRADTNGQIWAANTNVAKAVATYTKERWRHLEELPKYLKNEKFLFEVATFDGKPCPVIAFPKLGLWYHDQARWQHIDIRQIDKADQITNITSWHDGLLLMTDKGLLTFDGTTFNKEVSRGLPTHRYDILAAATETFEGRQRLWVYGHTWVGYLQDGRFTLCQTKKKGPKTRFKQAKPVPDGFGGLFFGDQLTLNHYNATTGRIRELGTKEGLPGNGVTELLRDRDHTIWITGERGITQLPSLSFTNYQKTDGLLENEVSALIPFGNDGLLLGHNTGMTLLRESQATRIEFTDLSTSRTMGRIMDFHPGPNGSVIAAGSGGGVLFLNPDLSYRRVRPPDPSWLISSVWYDPEHQLLQTGSNQGLHTLKDGLYKDAGMPLKMRKYVRKIDRTKDGVYWYATAGEGVYRYDGTWRNYTGSERNDNNIYTVWNDPGGTVWVGALSGLLQLKNERLAPPTDPSFHLERTVYFLLGDDKGLWAGTDNGVYHLKKGAEPAHYSVAHGLVGFETNRGAGYIDKDGSLWIGTDQGLSHLRLPDPPIMRKPPLTGIDSIEIDNELYDAQTPLVLPTGLNDILFKYRAVTMLSDLGVQFQTRLEGFEPQWTEPFSSEDRIARYTNLPPATYRFHLRARLTNDAWSPTVSSATITIPKSMEETWWYKLMRIVLPIIVCLLVFAYITTKRMSINLEKLVIERTSRLQVKIEEHRAAEARYQALSEELENRVRERTAELKTIQKEQLETAHYAGMAEIATSVLHNVGNILNSISTSGYLIQETLSKSAVTTLERANLLLSEHLDDFAIFLHTDPRGPKLLQMYLSLGKRFKQENQQCFAQLDHMMERIQTIKNVVSQQHNYATNVYQTEDVALQQLVETALTILEEGMNTHHVAVERHFQKVPMVRVQKTKLIHTLVNILKNAREAVQSAQNAKGLVRIELIQEGHEVVLTITDSGIGIAPEHLPRIFTHGFTTKPMGHGFGLHSCANAMKDMGGSIEVQSEGLGKGATFVLRFTQTVPGPPN